MQYTCFEAPIGRTGFLQGVANSTGNSEWSVTGSVQLPKDGAVTAFQREAARREALRLDRLRQEALIREAPKEPAPDSTDEHFYQTYQAITRYWIIVLVFLVLGGALVAGANAVRSPSYTSTSTITWNPNYRAELPVLYGAPSANIQPTLDLATAAVWVRGDTVMASAAAVVGVAAHDLRDHTTVKSSPLDETIMITVRASSAADAQEDTDAVTNSFVKESQNRVLAALKAQAAQVAAALTSISGNATSSETADLRNNQALLAAAAVGANGPASVVQGATASIDARGSLTLNAAIGGALGLVLGVLVAIGLGARDRRHDRRQSPSA